MAGKSTPIKCIETGISFGSIIKAAIWLHESQAPLTPATHIAQYLSHHINKTPRWKQTKNIGLRRRKVKSVYGYTFRKDNNVKNRKSI